jgi:hypothetical protein
MIIRMNSVTKVNVSVRQIVTTIFLIQGHLRSDYKSHRSTIHFRVALKPFQPEGVPRPHPRRD